MGDKVNGGAVPEWQVLNGDCLEVLRRLPNDCIGAMITDPPAGIGFMGKEWDSDKGGRGGWIAWLQSVMTEALRVLKPGAHALVWAIPRTSHWTATALENAGFEIRDVVSHHFGTGFPKSLNISKAIDAAAGAEREVLSTRSQKVAFDVDKQGGGGWAAGEVKITADATAAAAAWHGWGTALKPATEHWILCRKPLAGTVSANVQEHGTGGINIDACRIEGPPSVGGASSSENVLGGMNDDGWRPQVQHIDRSMSQGRWPANLILSHSAECNSHAPSIEGDWCAPGCPVAELDAQTSDMRAGKSNTGSKRGGTSLFGQANGTQGVAVGHDQGGKGGASRFFYCAKPSTSEREEGLDHLPKKAAAEITERTEDSAGINNPRAGAGRTSKGRANHHPTVKSIALMSYLVKMISPPGAIVLDPFSGSGTTGVAAVLGGWTFLGIEKEPEYAVIARARIEHALTKAVTSTVIGLAAQESTP